jgi:hypothetical protein
MYYFAPKVTFFEKSNLSLSGGVLYLSFTGSEGYFGVYYGVGTYGSQKASLTAGLGYSFANEKNAEDPIVMLGIDVQISSRLKFISENWFFSGGTNLNTFGIRFFGEALAADFALMRIPEMESGFPFFPWISFAYNFGTQHMTQQTGDRGIPEPVRYPSPTCRISLHYVPMSSANPYKEKLEQLLGTSSSIQGDDLFDKGDSETSKGTRLSLSAEYSMTDELAVGISISSLGALIGSPATTQLEKSIVGGQSPSYYYGNYNFYAQYSFLSGSAIISYVPFRLFTDDNSTTMRIGCGLGLTEIYVGFKSKLPWGGGDISGLIDKVDTRKMNGVAYASIDKRVTTLLGIGLSVEYFYLQSVNVPETIFETGIIRYDYSTNPPTQTPITDILPVHSINFSEVRIAL